MIFICYSWADAEIVHYLKRQLTYIGCDVWIDSEHLDLDAPLEGQIRRALHESSCVLLFDSPNSRDSKWVRRELDWAQGAGIDIVSWPIKNAEERLEGTSYALPNQQMASALYSESFPPYHATLAPHSRYSAIRLGSPSSVVSIAAITNAKLCKLSSIRVADAAPPSSQSTNSLNK